MTPYTLSHTYLKHVQHPPSLTSLLLIPITTYMWNQLKIRSLIYLQQFYRFFETNKNALDSHLSRLPSLNDVLLISPPLRNNLPSFTKSEPSWNIPSTIIKSFQILPLRNLLMLDRPSRDPHGLTGSKVPLHNMKKMLIFVSL